ncbi:Uncharacterised protein [Arthrobacter agilis]|uniref:hypothetical protein n=1 Tax=Arthrobacter agilis TaxID=37921 RepID=UPI000F6C39AE|nr:hypothetical protein [Arthrobacter agilis]VDR32549.1 Uncharacterised protein [Arthrobacter agilis]
METRHRYKRGTPFIYFGTLMVALGLMLTVGGQGALPPILLLAGAACLIIGFVRRP